MTNMKLAVNYAPELAELVAAKQVQIDLFKCPPWPDMLTEAQQVAPAYVHFPFIVGRGTGDVYDEHTAGPLDPTQVDHILQTTETRLVNLHLIPQLEDYPDATIDSLQSDLVAQIIENLIKDVQGACARWGAERVIVENETGDDGHTLLAAVLPEVISTVVAETGCGFLFDIAHARLAAKALGTDPKVYIQSLPLAETREVHMTGIQFFGPEWIALMTADGVDPANIARFTNRWMDHFPMMPADWQCLDWALPMLSTRTAQTPEWLAFEAGGVGPFWQTVSDNLSYIEQIPRLWQVLNPSK